MFVLVTWGHRTILGHTGLEIHHLTGKTVTLLFGKLFCLYDDRNFASGLPAQITAGINLGLSGMPFSGSDIGGFEWYVDSTPPDLELWSRWAEAGCFSGLMHEQGILPDF